MKEILDMTKKWNNKRTPEQILLRDDRLGSGTSRSTSKGGWRPRRAAELSQWQEGDRTVWFAWSLYKEGQSARTGLFVSVEKRREEEEEEECRNQPRLRPRRAPRKP